MPLAKKAKTAKSTRTKDTTEADTGRDSNTADFESRNSMTKFIKDRKLESKSTCISAAQNSTLATEVQDDDSLTLKPLGISDGPLDARRALMLEPVQVTQRSRFLDLPIELREMIYEHLLVAPQPITMSIYQPPSHASHAVELDFGKSPGHFQDWIAEASLDYCQKPGKLSLLRVSRQLRREAAPIAYGLNAFNFYNMKNFSIYQDKIGDMKQFLGHVQFETHSYDESEAIAAFGHSELFARLRSVIFHHEFIKRLYQPATSSLESFIKVFGNMLNAIHKTQQPSDIPCDVRNVIQLDHRICIDDMKRSRYYHWDCRREQSETSHCYKEVPCDIHPDELPKRCKKQDEELRVLIGQAIGIEQ